LVLIRAGLVVLGFFLLSPFFLPEVAAARLFSFPLPFGTLSPLFSPSFGTQTEHNCVLYFFPLEVALALFFRGPLPECAWSFLPFLGTPFTTLSSPWWFFRLFLSFFGT